jgi:hypothetical protein
VHAHLESITFVSPAVSQVTSLCSVACAADRMKQLSIGSALAALDR